MPSSRTASPSSPRASDRSSTKRTSANSSVALTIDACRSRPISNPSPMESMKTTEDSEPVGDRSTNHRTTSAYAAPTSGGSPGSEAEHPTSTTMNNPTRRLRHDTGQWSPTNRRPGNLHPLPRTKRTSPARPPAGRQTRCAREPGTLFGSPRQTCRRESRRGKRWLCSDRCSQMQRGATTLDRGHALAMSWAHGPACGRGRGGWAR